MKFHMYVIARMSSGLLIVRDLLSMFVSSLRFTILVHVESDIVHKIIREAVVSVYYMSLRVGSTQSIPPCNHPDQ